MLDKELIKRNFSKSINTYNDNASIQKKMAEKLVSLLENKSYNSVLEIGSYTGILTQEVYKKISFKNYTALDILDVSRGFIKNISKDIEFVNEDIEYFSTERKFDLIISNASLQWSDDFISTVKKLKSMLNPNGCLAFSIFTKDNFYEIKDAFGEGLDYPKIDEITSFLQGAKIFEEEYKIEFSTSKEILKHLKLTGVNSVRKKDISYTQIKKGLDILEKKYNNKITYKPLYIID